MPGDSDTIAYEMSTATARIAYDGDLVRAGLMDVRDLAPALLEIGALCERANEILNGDRAQISVQVRADFKTGSFAINLEVVQTIFDHIKGALWGDSAQDAKYILEWLGLVGASIPASVITLYRWLRGHPVRPEREDDKNVTIVINNNTIVLPREVLILYNDSAIRSRVEGALTPLLKEGIDEFQVRQGSDAEPTIIERVSKEEALEAYEARREDGGQETTISDYTTRIPLVIVKPPFREGLKWDVARDSRSAKFGAEMKDLEFLGRVQRREEKFGVGDILDVDLHTRSFLNAQGQLRTEYEILKVWGLIEPPAGRQRTLFDDPPKIDKGL